MKKVIAIASVFALLASAGVASAFGSSTEVEAEVNNSATVKNYVDTTASTGGNDANGGSAKSRARVSGYYADGDADSKAVGGDAIITTGNATAKSEVSNFVNTNDVRVTSDCGCSSRRGSSETEAEVKNRADIKNDVDTEAKTGYNDANGGRARSKAKTSDDGDADSEAKGGFADILTGDAKAKAEVVNVVNSNVVRVRR
jgi:hypothetical protein